MADRASGHKGERRFVGGPMDGQVDRLVFATPSDYPLTIETGKRDGVRHFYEADLDDVGQSVVRYHHKGDHA